MSTFYSFLSTYYDILFPVREATVRFLSERVPKGGRVLDLGCATGTYACALSRDGYTVTGVDSAADMIRRAEKKRSGDNAEFIVWDMIEYVKSVEKERFDLVYTIGNTLPHLDDLDSVRTLVASVKECLAPGGHFVVQITNFNRVTDCHICELPMILHSEQGITMKRTYHVMDDGLHVSFDAELTHEGETCTQSTPLLIITHTDLHSIFTDAGFDDIREYGAFSGSPWEPDSAALVLTGTKR